MDSACFTKSTLNGGLQFCTPWKIVEAWRAFQLLQATDHGITAVVTDHDDQLVARQHV
jgi:predicted HAD superfamily phosphohydrolase YqeG